MRPAKLFCLTAAVISAALLDGCSGGSSTPPSPLVVNTSSVSQAVANTAYSMVLSASGGTTPYAWNVSSGALPSGIFLSRDGVLSGTPTSAGTSSFMVSVTDSQHPPSVANATFSLTVNPALQITTGSLRAGSPGVFYTATLTATGGIGPYHSWIVTQGSLAPGLTLDSGTGVISGTPTTAGTSNFTVQVSDSESASANATAMLSLVINAPPARSAALYISAAGSYQPVGLQIASDGSLSALSSSPELAIDGVHFAASPTLPLLFVVSNATGMLESLLINPDYSVSLNSSASPGTGGSFAIPAVDPTGSNLYVLGTIDSKGTPGVTVLSADGSLRTSSSISVPNLSNASSIFFTPDGNLVFINTCAGLNGVGNIVSLSRSSDGTLSVIGSTSTTACVKALAVSADGKHLATPEVQVYSIAVNGSLTPVLSEPFTVKMNGNPIPVTDLTWDASGLYVLAGTSTGVAGLAGGIAVLAFSGNSLTESVQPMDGGVIRLLRTGSFVYALPECGLEGTCLGVSGFSFQNGQLSSVPGSPYAFGNSGIMVVY